MESEECIFCKIVRNEIPSKIVFENEFSLAFLDINPVSIGHTLIIPQEHWENIYETPEQTLAEMIAVVKRISVAIKKTVGADGIKVIQLNGKAAGQVVMHIHIHVIPIISNDRIVIGHRERVSLERIDLDDTANKIKENLK